MITSLVICALSSFVVHFFASALNEIVILGFPLGFYMAAQGSLLIFVVLIFWFAHRQDAIAREFGVAETECGEVGMAHGTRGTDFTRRLGRVSGLYTGGCPALLVLPDRKSVGS